MSNDIYYDVRVPKCDDAEIIAQFISDKNDAIAMAKIMSYNGNRCRAMVCWIDSDIKHQVMYFKNGVQVSKGVFKRNAPNVAHTFKLNITSAGYEIE